MHSYKYILLSSAAQIVLQLDRVPDRDCLCPGEQLQLLCKHNDTFNEPQWRVINGTQVVYRGITFRDTTLEAHSLIENTRTLEVLVIDEVQPNFHNLRYSCFYDTNGGERKSNETTVKIHGRCVCVLVYMFVCCVCECVCVQHMFTVHNIMQLYSMTYGQTHISV